MKRRLLSAVLALAMVMSLLPSALAAKKQTQDVKPNIYEDIGSFETEEQVKKVYAHNSTITCVSGGHEGKCAYVKLTSDWGGMRFPFPAVVGETYDISFWLKTDDDPATARLIMYYDNSGVNYSFIKPTGQFKNEWTQYTLTYEYTGLSDQGQLYDIGGEVIIRYGNGQELKSYYIDELQIYPHGKVPTADYSALKMSGSGKPVVKEDSSNAPIEATPVVFSDMENHWAKTTVNQLATYGYINGMGDGTYSPNTNVTRAQFTKMMTDMFDIADPEYDASYSDIKGDEWFASSVALATRLGIVDPAMTFGNRFLPDQAITREEAASIAARMAEFNKAEKKEKAPSFKDAGSISAWASKGVLDAASYGLIKGYEDGSYKPQANITRAEAATILKRIAEFSTLFAVYVDAENGSDNNDGTEQAPFKTVAAAQERVRESNKTMKNDIYVYIRGEHYLDKALTFSKEDSGFNNYRVIYTSWGDEKPVFTMGKKYTGFELHDADQNIYKLFIGGANSRQVYFNNVRGIRARTVAGLKNATCVDTGNEYIYTSENTEFLDFKHPEEIEGFWYSNWRYDTVRMTNLKKVEDGKISIEVPKKFRDYMYGKTGKLKDHRLYPAHLENAYEFLDEPSEWYIDNSAGYLYYIPREGEDMSTMVATIPVGEKVLTVNGESGENPVRNLTFNNIEFSDTGWMGPTKEGGVSFVQDRSCSGTGDIISAIHIKDASYINFTNNRLTRMGACAMLTSRAVQHCNFFGNEFFDISGGGLSLGSVIETDLGPGDPVLTTEQSEWNAWNKVHNNFFYGIGLQYKSCAALSAAYPRHSSFSYNYIGTTPYSGIHTGWGWGDSNATKGTNTYDFEVSHNYISESTNDRLYDGASIYTLSSTSLEAKGIENNNRIYQNYFENPRNGYGTVYPDEGSSYWHIYENVNNIKDVTGWRLNYGDIGYHEKDKIWWLQMWANTIHDNNIHDNYSSTKVIRNSTGNPTNIIENNHVYPDGNWPENVQAIIDNAYIQPEYIDNFDKKDGPLSFVSREVEYIVPLNGSVPLDIKIYGNYMKEYDIKDFDIDFWVSDPELLSVDDNGVMTAHGTGIVYVVANANINGFIQVKEYKISAGEKVEGLEPSHASLNMVKNYTVDVNVEAVTSFGNKTTVPSENIKFEIADPSIATVDEQGFVTAHQSGETVLKICANDQGFVTEIEVPIKVISLSQPDSLKLPYVKDPAALFSMSNWTGNVVKNGNGITVKGSPNYNTSIKDGKLYAFDMTVDGKSGWPSLTFCATDRMGNYTNNNTYLIGFKEDYIEFQRFNKGERTMIYGDASMNPVGGPGIPNTPENPIYKLGEPMSVIVGVLAHEKGTRIVLTINGENMFDYIDEDPNACAPDGFFGVYDQFTFAPYTGRTALGK